MVEQGRLPGRQHRQLAGVGRARDARPGQGPDCIDPNVSRVPRVKFRA
jgi:hypothetical protein